MIDPLGLLGWNDFTFSNDYVWLNGQLWAFRNDDGSWQEWPDGQTLLPTGACSDPSVHPLTDIVAQMIQESQNQEFISNLLGLGSFGASVAFPKFNDT